MKSNILILSLVLAVVLPRYVFAIPTQDLDRINNIINQARDLADNARSAAQSQQQFSPPQTDFKNPFARSDAQSALRVNGADTDVAVDNEQIRINAGGREFVIPRVSGETTPNTIVPARAAHNANDRNKVSGALTMAGGYRSFADAVRFFRNADFAKAATLVMQVESANTQQHAFYPFQSLCLFATGDYPRAAELAYSASAQSQIWSWRQLRSYYGNPEAYAQHYSRLQNAAKDPGCDLSVRFLLGYHHLMLGHRQDASNEFEQVLRKLPNDPVTLHLLTLARETPPQPTR